MQLYAGLDLHSRNTYIGIIDKEFKRVFGKRETGYCAFLALFHLGWIVEQFIRVWYT